jgi:sarcosine oxidase subunit beta
MDRTLIVGAGIAGLTLAHRLARSGVGHICVMEKSLPGAGASGKSGAMFRTNLTTEIETRLAVRSLAAFEDFHQRWPNDQIFTQTGMMLVDLDGASDAAVARAQAWGSSIESLHHQDREGVSPLMTLAEEDGTYYDRLGGFVNAPALLSALYKECQQMGVTFYLDAIVTGLVMSRGKIRGVSVGGEFVSGAKVVLATGVGTSNILGTIGLEFDIAPRMTRVAVYRSKNLRPGLFPIVLDVRQQAWFRPVGTGMVLVGAERGGVDLEETSEATEEFPDELQPLYKGVLANRFNALADAEFSHGWAGIYMTSRDALPLVGEVDEFKGLYLHSGDNGGAFKIAPALSESLAEVVMWGGGGYVDISCLRPGRLAL